MKRTTRLAKAIVNQDFLEANSLFESMMRDKQRPLLENLRKRASKQLFEGNKS